MVKYCRKSGGFFCCVQQKGDRFFYYRKDGERWDLLRSMNGRRKGVWLLLGATLLLLSVVSVKAKTAGQLTFTDVTQSGDQLDVKVNVKDNPGIWGLKLKVAYDTSLLNLTKVDNGTVFPIEDVTLPADYETSPLVYLATKNALQNSTGNGTLLVLHFQVKKDAAAGAYLLSMKADQAIDVEGQEVPLNVGELCLKAELNKKKDVTITASDQPEDIKASKQAQSLKDKTSDQTEKKEEVTEEKKTQSEAVEEKDSSKEQGSAENFSSDKENGNEKDKGEKRDTAKTTSKGKLAVAIISVVVILSGVAALLIRNNKKERGEKKE